MYESKNMSSMNNAYNYNRRYSLQNSLQSSQNATNFSENFCKNFDDFSDRTMNALYKKKENSELISNSTANFSCQKEKNYGRNQQKDVCKNNNNYTPNKNGERVERAFLPKESEGGKKTLILDIDETLVHSAFNSFYRQSDITLNINVEGMSHIVYVLKRPQVDEFINQVSKMFELVVFTASISQYANPLMDILDKNKLIKHRLYREHCVYNKGMYIKDLMRLGRDLKDVIIIDNNPISYALNEDNGIPILTWHDDLNDRELMKLIPLLENIFRKKYYFF